MDAGGHPRPGMGHQDIRTRDAYRQNRAGDAASNSSCNRGRQLKTATASGSMPRRATARPNTLPAWWPAMPQPACTVPSAPAAKPSWINERTTPSHQAPSSHSAQERVRHVRRPSSLKLDTGESEQRPAAPVRPPEILSPAPPPPGAGFVTGWTIGAKAVGAAG